MNTLEKQMNIIACRLRANNYSEDYIDAYLIGYAEGRAEGILTVAKNLKLQQIPIAAIVSATGLTQEEIENL